MSSFDRPITPPRSDTYATKPERTYKVPSWAKVEGLKEPPMRPVKQDAREMREAYEGGEG